MGTRLFSDGLQLTAVLLPQLAMGTRLFSDGLQLTAVLFLQLAMGTMIVNTNNMIATNKDSFVSLRHLVPSGHLKTLTLFSTDSGGLKCSSGQCTHELFSLQQLILSDQFKINE